MLIDKSVAELFLMAERYVVRGDICDAECARIGISNATTREHAQCY